MMLTVAGENAARLIETVFVVAAVAGDTATRAATSETEDEEYASHAPSIPVPTGSLSRFAARFYRIRTAS